MLTRRGLLAIGLGAVTAGAGLAQRARGGDSVLRVRPHQPTTSVAPGEHALDLGGDRDGLLIVPQQYRPTTAAPLALMLHGAEATPAGWHPCCPSRIPSAWCCSFPIRAGRRGTPSAADTGPTWNSSTGRSTRRSTRCAVDQRKLAIGGFSDGATYALSLGLDNGSLFTHVMAFSPGFIAARRPSGKPRIFISHGRSDTILPIDVTSRRIVPELEDAGYAVTYQEFDGPHTVPQPVAQDAFKWFTR